MFWPYFWYILARPVCVVLVIVCIPLWPGRLPLRFLGFLYIPGTIIRKTCQDYSSFLVYSAVKKKRASERPQIWPCTCAASCSLGIDFRCAWKIIKIYEMRKYGQFEIQAL